MLVIEEILDQLHSMQADHEKARDFCGTASGFHEGYTQALIDVAEWFYGLLDEAEGFGDFYEEADDV